MKKTTKKIPDHLNTRKRVQITFSEPTLTKQSFKNECDINQVVAKFVQTGQLPLTNNQEPQYGDAPDQDIDLKSSIDTVNQLKSEFYELSPEMQKSFKGNFKNYAQFLSDYEADPGSIEAYFDSLNIGDKDSDLTKENKELSPEKTTTEREK